MKILLIGGSSDLGRELGKSLPYDFVNLDVKNDNPYVKEFLQVDITNIHSLTGIKNMEFSHIIHISGIHPILTDLKNKDLMFDVNVKGVFNVLETIKDHKCKEYILISSSSAKNVKTEYGKTKFLSEKVLESFCQGNGINGYALRTRGFTPYYSKYYKNFIDYANWVLTGAVHIKDVVSCIDLCLNKKSKNFEEILVDGKDCLSPKEREKWGKEMLKNKYPKYAKFIEELTVLEKVPVYQNQSNSVGYSPSFGINELFLEYDEYKRKG